MKILDLEIAKQLKIGDIIHFNGYRNAKMECMEFKVNGQAKLWKTDINRIRIPLKYGLNNHGEINEKNVNHFHLESQCPLDYEGRLTHNECKTLNMTKMELCKYYKLKAFDTDIPQDLFDILLSEKFHPFYHFVYLYDKPYTQGILFPLTIEGLERMHDVFPDYPILKVFK